jgi:uncharacterized protein (DUF983 family)
VAKCPRCGSGNVVGFEGEWECFDCGYRFRTSKTSFRSGWNVLRLVTVILFAIALLLFVYAAIVTNVLGPIQVRVIQTTTTTQFATLTLTSSPPTEIPAGSDLELTIKLDVKTSFSNGILVIEVTATDFTPTTSDVSARYSTGYFCGASRGWTDMSASSTTNGVLLKSPNYDTFKCSFGESGYIYIKISFKKPNPTPDGKYLVRIWIET